MNIKRLLILILLALPMLVRADLLTDILSGRYKATPLQPMVSITGGEQYAVCEGNRILAYDYKEGKEQEVLFDAKDTKITSIDSIEGFLLSPNPRYLLVYKNRQQIFRRSFKADYYIYDRQRKELKPLSDTLPVQAPVFSPNGRYIAFSRNNNLYIHKLDFGTEVAVTTDGRPGGVINGTPDWLYEEEFSTTCLYAFSPDSKQLAFVRLDETEVPEFAWQTMLDDGYPQLHSLKYPRAGEQNAKVSVVVYDTYYKSLKTMDLKGDEDCYIPRIRWTNSSDKLAIFRLNRSQNKLEMLLANPKSTVITPCYTEENKSGWIDFACIDEWQFMSDNSFVAVNETSGYRHAYLYSATGQKQRQLTAGNYDVTCVYGLDESTQTLFYQAADKSPMERNVYALNLKKGKPQLLTSQEGTHSAVFNDNFTMFVDNYSSVSTANEYTLYDRNGKKVRTLLSNIEKEQNFKQLQLPQKEFFRFTTERGDTLNGWLLRPLNFDENRQYPVLMVQYSGPESQQVLNRWRIDWEYYLAQEGYVVACVDGRGTGARGRVFRQQTYKNIGIREAEDQVSAAHYIQTLSYVDAEKIGIWGWSYGGFMTLLSMSQPQSPFRCGVAVAPVTTFRLYDSAYTERFMQRPQTNEKGYQQISLPDMAEQLQGRLLIVHGLADDNVHCQQTWKYIDALIRAGKQFDMQIYPDDNHFLRNRSNYEHLYRRKAEFLQTNLKSDK